MHWPEVSIKLDCIAPKVLLQLHDFKTSSTTGISIHDLFFGQCGDAVLALHWSMGSKAMRAWFAMSCPGWTSNCTGWCRDYPSFWLRTTWRFCFLLCLLDDGFIFCSDCTMHIHVNMENLVHRQTNKWSRDCTCAMTINHECHESWVRKTWLVTSVTIHACELKGARF